MTVKETTAESTPPDALPQILSGGQTGVDRAALDAAIRWGLPHGGYCPRHRWAEDGSISNHYPMIEVAGGPAVRTRANVEAAHATVVIHPGRTDAGTALTLDCCRELEKPLLVLDMGSLPPPSAADRLSAFLAGGHACVNVAGPRQSHWPEAYTVTRRLLDPVFRAIAARSTNSAPASAGDR